MPEAQSRVGANRTLAIDDLGDAIDRHLDLTRQFGGADAEFLQLVAQMFARVDSAAGLQPMVIYAATFDGTTKS